MPFPVGSGKVSDGIASTTPDKTSAVKNFGIPTFSSDGLVIRISPNNYHLLFEPGTEDWWLQSVAFRKRGLGAYEEVRKRRKEGFERLFEGKEGKNEWMKEMDGAGGAGATGVERTKSRFERWLKEGPQVLDEGESQREQDVVMAER